MTGSVRFGARRSRVGPPRRLGAGRRTAITGRGGDWIAVEGEAAGGRLDASAGEQCGGVQEEDEPPVAQDAVAGEAAQCL